MNPTTSTSQTDPSTQPKPSRAGLVWGTLMAIAGAILTAVGNGVQSDDATKSESLQGGLMMGIGGVLLIVSVITLLVALVHRARAR